MPPSLSGGYKLAQLVTDPDTLSPEDISALQELTTLSTGRRTRLALGELRIHLLAHSYAIAVVRRGEATEPGRIAAMAVCCYVKVLGGAVAEIRNLAMFERDNEAAVRGSLIERLTNWAERTFSGGQRPAQLEFRDGLVAEGRADPLLQELGFKEVADGAVYVREVPPFRVV